LLPEWSSPRPSRSRRSPPVPGNPLMEES
jgi:hypothetical protein